MTEDRTLGTSRVYGMDRTKDATKEAKKYWGIWREAGKEVKNCHGSERKKEFQKESNQ